MSEVSLKYIQDQFGIEFVENNFLEISKMPLFLRKGYKYDAVSVGTVKLLLVDCSKKSNLNGDELIKNVENIQKYTEYSSAVVLVFTSATNYLRELLIASRIAFVIPGKQIYIPMLGTVFVERMQSKYKTEKLVANTKLQPTTQALFLNLLVTNDFSRSMEVIAKELNVTKMSISRAFKKLCEMDLVGETSVKGGCSYLFKDRPYEVWEKGKSKLFNPKMKEIYVFEDSISMALKDELVISGESALAEYSMLSSPKNPVFGITSKRFKNFEGQYKEVPFKDQGTCIIEVWKHELPHQNGIVNPLGVAILLQDVIDERINNSIIEMLGNYTWRE